MPRNDKMETVQNIKQRFEIIGNDPKLNRAIEKAIQVAPTDISVLVKKTFQELSIPYHIENMVSTLP